MEEDKYKEDGSGIILFIRNGSEDEHLIFDQNRNRDVNRRAVREVVE